jgi:hypothetical protein
VHQASAVTVSVGLFLLYGGMTAEATRSPILGLAAAGVLVGMLLMGYRVMRPRRGKVAAESSWLRRGSGER